MLRVASLVAQAGIREQEEMESLISHLRGKGYLPMIRSMLTSMLDLIKLPEGREQLITEVIAKGIRDPFMRRRHSEALGELFFADDIICILLPLRVDILQASAIGHAEQEQHLSKFCQDIESAIKIQLNGRRVRGMSFEWKAMPKLRSERGVYRYSGFEDLFEEEPEQEVTELKLTKPNYTPEDLTGVKLLVDTNIRQFILRLAQLRKMTSKDATQATEHPIIQTLLSKGLVVEEYLLTCKQDQHTICVVPSRDHLSEEPTASFHCSVCGRPFAEENLQVIYTLAEKAKKLVDSSLWMSIWVTELLTEKGVRREGIKWGLRASGEELDIMVEDFGSRIFLELKDREFGLGDAYPFSYRVTRYGGRLGGVVTMDKVATDAKDFFKEEADRRESFPEIRYLEGSAGIKEGIAELVNDMALRQVRRLIQPFSIRLGFDLWPPVRHWIDMKMSQVSKTLA